MAGFRYSPEGRGLEGFYIVPRVGGGTIGGLAVSGELGYSWFFSGFITNLGAGVLYNDGAKVKSGVGPLLNLSIGYGG
jgi:hypothetical protein